MIDISRLPHRPDSIHHHTFGSIFSKLYQPNTARASIKNEIDLALYMSVSVYADSSEKEQDRQYCKALALTLMEQGIHISFCDASAESMAQQLPYWAMLSTIDSPPELTYVAPNLSNVSLVRWDFFLLNVLRNAWIGIAKKDHLLMQQSIQNIQACRQLQAQWEEPYLKQIGCNSTVRALTLCTLYHLIKGTELILEHRLYPHAAFKPDACMIHLGNAKRASVQCSIEIMQATHAIYTSAAELFYHRNEAAHTGDSYVV